MIKNGIKLLVTLVLTTAVVAVVWTPSHSASRPSIGTSQARMSPSTTTTLNGEPDPFGAPAPRTTLIKDSNNPFTSPWWSRTGKIWAIWHLKTGW